MYTCKLDVEECDFTINKLQAKFNKRCRGVVTIFITLLYISDKILCGCTYFDTRSYTINQIARMITY